MYSNNSEIMQDNAYPISSQIIHYQFDVIMNGNN